MALPEKLNFVEYRESMPAVPVEAINSAYDRMDKIANQTEAGANKILMTMAEEMNFASDGDKPYLKNLYDQIQNELNTAVDAGQLPSYSRSIKQMVGTMLRDPMYQAVRTNANSVKASLEAKKQLAMKYGEENVVMAGDDPSNFSTQGPDGKPQLFMGMPQQRPNYLKGMDETYFKATDIVDSTDAVDAWVESGGAWESYKNTPTGRIHMDELSRDISRSRGQNPVPFIRADRDIQNEAIRLANEQLRTTGYRYINTAKTKDRWGNERYKDLEGKQIVPSGLNSTTITDGTERPDQVINVLDDQADKSELDQQLLALFQNDKDFVMYQPAGSSGNFRRSSGKVNPDEVRGAKLTANASNNGLPLIQLTRKGQGEKSPPIVEYIEMQPEDLMLMRESLGGFMYQTKRSTAMRQQSAIPAIFNIMATDLSVKMSQPGDFTNLSVPLAGVKVSRIGKRYEVTRNGQTEQVDSEASLRHLIGATILNRQSA